MLTLLFAAFFGVAHADDLKRACQLNKSEACVELAYRLEQRGETQEARQAHEDACRLNEAQSCFTAAYAYQTGKGSSRSSVKARELYTSGCRLGHGAACVNLGVIYVKGQGVTIDLTAAAAYFSQGCEVGDRRGCLHYGVQLLHGTAAEQNISLGVKLLDVACQVGEVEACDALHSDAGPVLQVACEQQKSEHCYHAARFATDKTQAYRLSTLGCDAGNMLACVKQGFFEIDKQPEMAIKRFQSACDARVGEGCFSMAIAYLEGRGVSRSESQTLIHLNKACDLGDLRGCEQAAIFFRRIGDLQSAKQSLEKGCLGDAWRVALNSVSSKPRRVTKKLGLVCFQKLVLEDMLSPVLILLS